MLEGREAGRQVSRMQSGEKRREGSRKKKMFKKGTKFYPVTTIREKKKSIWICSRQNQKGRQKKPKM